MTPTAIKAMPAIVMQVRVKRFGAGRVFTNASWQPPQEGAVKSKSFLHWGHCFLTVQRPSSACIMSF